MQPQLKISFEIICIMSDTQAKKGLKNFDSFLFCFTGKVTTGTYSFFVFDSKNDVITISFSMINTGYSQNTMLCPFKSHFYFAINHWHFKWSPKSIRHFNDIGIIWLCRILSLPLVNALSNSLIIYLKDIKLKFNIFRCSIVHIVPLRLKNLKKSLK